MVNSGTGKRRECQESEKRENVKTVSFIKKMKTVDHSSVFCLVLTFGGFPLRKVSGMETNSETGISEKQENLLKPALNRLKPA